MSVWPCCCCCWVTTGAWGWSSEALELRVEGGRVCHSWCMCVVVMAMVGWMGAGMELVLGKHAGQSQVVGRMSGDAGAFPECVDEYTDYTRSYHHPCAQFWVGSSRNWSVFLERPNTGRHKKAPVRCPCSRLAALHGAPRTHDLWHLYLCMSCMPVYFCVNSLIQ